MNKLVIYHANCYDGVTAAYVCYRALDMAFEGMQPSVDYLPLNYSDPPPDVKGKDVYIVDFSFKREIMRQLAYDANNLVCLDHHKTAQEALEGLAKEILIETGKDITIVFDMNRSGAGIAWDYFFKESSRPDLVNYIEDRDLWKFTLPNSKEYNAFIQSFDINLHTWIYELSGKFNINDPNTLEIGKALLRLENKYVKQIVANAKLIQIDMCTIPHVQTSILMSEVCDQLLKDYPDYSHVAYSFQRKDGKIQYGLRSRPSFDCSVIAKKFGGGGHKQAAGFELDKDFE